ncbi:MAG: hypothetical protein M3N91_17945 [Pseudomonadota bacterium]|nr:hypothetical protein [Pseudomonadota bacterium]
MRSFATAACFIAALIGAGAIFLHEPMQSTLNYVIGVWLLSKVLVTGAYKRKYWKGFDMKMSEIYRRAKDGTLPKTSPLEWVTDLGMMVLMGVSVYLSIARVA